MTKMDNFFNKKLTEYTPDEDGWNVPSEQLWENALPHFPKKKKSNRGLIFFWSFLATVLVISTVYFFNISSPQTSITEIEKFVPSEKSTILKESSFTNRNDNNALNSIASNNLLNKNVSETSSLALSKATDTNQKKEPSKEIEQSSQLNHIATNHITTNGGEDPKTQINNTKKLDQLDISNLAMGSSGENMSDNSNTYSRDTQLAKSILNANHVVNSPVSNDNDNIGIATSALEKQNQVSSISLLPSVVPVLFQDRKEAIEIQVNPLVIQPNLRKSIYPKSEVGLAHMVYPVYLILKSVTIDSDNPSDIIDQRGSYINVNSYYNKWVAPRWSISTGLHYTKFDVGLDLEIQDTITSEIDEFINARFEETIIRSSDVGDLDNIEVTLIDGHTVEENDIVQLKGSVNLELIGIQLPVMINYHFFTKRKFEFGVGLGASLDYVRITQDDIKFDIYKSKELVAIAKQNADREAFLDYSIYAQSFTKYRITPNINIGLSLRISVLEPIFSGFETGVYYRWN